MIIRFLKSNNPAAFFVLPAIAILIWIWGFFVHSQVDMRYGMPLYEFFARPITDFPWLTKTIGLLLVIGEGFLLNYIVNENEVLTKKTALPALLYIVFISNNSAMLDLHPILFANLFLLFALSKILNSYRKDIAFSQAFDAGLLISIATLFYFPCIVFLPMIGIALIIFRPFLWREWVISFLGVLVPYVFAFTFYFWNNSVDYLIFDKMFFPLIFKGQATAISPGFYFLLSVGLLIVLFSIGKLFNGLSGGAQRTKKALILMIWWLCFSALSILLAPEITTRYCSLLGIPLAVICSNYFIRMKRELWGEILFLVFFITLFVNLFINIF